MFVETCVFCRFDLPHAKHVTVLQAAMDGIRFTDGRLALATPAPKGKDQPDDTRHPHAR